MKGKKTATGTGTSSKPKTTGKSASKDKMPKKATSKKK